MLLIDFAYSGTELPWNLERPQLECLAQDLLWVDRGDVFTYNMG